MSHPHAVERFTVQPDAVEALAAELAALAAELSDDVAVCRSTAASFPAALDGDEGWTAGATASAWAALADVLATRADAVADTLVAAAAAYRAEDTALAARIGSGGPRARAVPR